MGPTYHVLSLSSLSSFSFSFLFLSRELDNSLLLLRSPLTELELPLPPWISNPSYSKLTRLTSSLHNPSFMSSDNLWHMKKKLEGGLISLFLFFNLGPPHSSTMMHKNLSGWWGGSKGLQGVGGLEHPYRSAPTDDRSTGNQRLPVAGLHCRPNS